MRLSRSLFAAVLGTTLFASAVPSHAQKPAPPTHPTSTPYAGDLGIFEDAGRAERLQIDRVMDLLGLKPGKVVADIGAGGGWFSIRAAKRVAGGANGGGKVIAEDINPQYVEAIRARAIKENLLNIEPYLGTPDNPRLAPDSIDAALMLKVYHEITRPAQVLENLRLAMRPGARFGVIDRNGSGADHGLDERIARKEIEAAGFKQVARYDFTKADGQDYFLIFEKK